MAYMYANSADPDQTVSEDPDQPNHSQKQIKANVLSY